MTSQLVPILTSTAGACLTAANWQEVAADSMAFGLDHLLMKPGLAVLQQITHLKDYLVCKGKLILNASQLKKERGQDTYIVKSRFDGSTVSIGDQQLFEFIVHHAPDLILLPFDFSLTDYLQLWPKTVMPFIHDEVLVRQNIEVPHGVYFDLDSAKSMSALSHWQSPRYVFGSFDWKQMQTLVQLGVEWIESDNPAALGLSGIVETAMGLVSIKDVSAQMQFEPLDKTCRCPTCRLGLSRAYLHHLYWHTPLLCQRYLIMHNFFYWRWCSMKYKTKVGHWSNLSATPSLKLI
jgi:queuine tRNA-ribosyltransferase